MEQSGLQLTVDAPGLSRTPSGLGHAVAEAALIDDVAQIRSIRVSQMAAQHSPLGQPPAEACRG